MPPTEEIAVTTNGKGGMKVSFPVRAFAAVAAIALTAFGSYTARPYLDTAAPAVAAQYVTPLPSSAGVSETLGAINTNLAALSERLARVEENTRYMAKDLERLSRDTAENSDNVRELQRDTARLQGRVLRP